jgi:hypothetical protein
MARHLGIRRLVTAITLAGLSDQAAAENPSRPEIVVEAFDHAGVPAETLARAKNDATRIFADVGVDIVWTDEAVGKDRRFVVHLIIRAKPPRPGIMGTALGDSRDTGGTALVYHDRVLEVARRGDLDIARVLAYGMAHEIGHLLLPYPSHSIAGIMHANWNGDELRDIGAGTLRFTPGEASAIRARASQPGAVALSDGTADPQRGR